MGEGQSWSDWLQNIGSQVIGSYAKVKYEQPYELEKMRIQARNSDGMLYDEGLPGQPPGGGGISTTTALMIGGALLLAVVLVRS